MKSLTQIIIAFIAVNLAIAGSASVEDARQAEAVIAQRQAELAEKTAQREAELAAADARAQADDARAQADDARAQADMALQQVQYSLAPAQARDGAESTTSGLLVLTSQTKAEDLANVTLDLNIMSRILDNKLGRAQRRTRFGSLIELDDLLGRSGQPGATQTQAMYIQGYAALFFMNVDFPLSPPQEVQVEKVKEGADPVWEQTKRELFLVQGSWFIDEQGTMNNEQKRQYDKDTVEQLKATLIKALKHAANIRNLKADESVILMASGTEASPLILTIRAKKADIDAYSTGKMTDDDFRQRTAILTSRASAGPERGQIGSWPSQNLRR
jgi:hypothetical protein